MPRDLSGDLIDPCELGKLGGLASLEHLDEVPSTMDRARQIAESATVPIPALVVADRQSRGRGRRGAAWWQAPGSLTASIVYDVADLGGVEPLPCWSLACGVAVAETIREIEPSVDARVRWPNDVEAGARKLAGILVETSGRGRVIFGIGINTTGSAALAPEGVRHRVATIPDLVGRPMPRSAVLAGILEKLPALCRAIAAKPDLLVSRYSPLCSLTGRPVRLHVGAEHVEGICRGIGRTGTILVETHRGVEPFASGTLTPPGTEWRG